MSKTYREGQMITGKAVDNRKVPLGTVIRYEHGTFIGQCSLLTIEGWTRQDATRNCGPYYSTEKCFRILHVGNDKPTL
jgi:hypothetical protein